MKEWKTLFLCCMLANFPARTGTYSTNNNSANRDSTNDSSTHEYSVNRDSVHGATVGAELVLEKIMYSWKLINIARSISQHDAPSFGHAIIVANLELYAMLYNLVLLSPRPLPPPTIATLQNALEGLFESHSAWCAVQKINETLCSQKIMSAVTALWSPVLA